MYKKNPTFALFAALFTFAAGAIAAVGLASTLAVQNVVAQTQQDAAQAGIARRIGTIKSISGNVLTLAPDSGPAVTVTVQPNARMLRIAPGAKDLKTATPVELQDLKVGDRVRVRGQQGSDANSVAALEVIVMSQSDLEAKHAQEVQDWQKRGMGGLVKSVDPAANTVTISVTGFGGTKSVAVKTSASTLQEIQPGDQLRARGDKNADGTELTADEVVTGSFRNVAGTVTSIDASAGTLSVQDLLSKKSVTVKITADSQLHQLPPEMAQRIAARLKGSMPAGMPGGTTGAGASSASSSAGRPAAAAPTGGSAASAGGQGASGPGGGMGGMRSGGAPDFNQMLNRMPAVTLADLHRGDAVLIVSTEGTSSSGATAITLLSGVEPILQAAPSASQAMMLAPWSLGGAPMGDASQ
jgi:hypothetical protein